MLCKSRRETIFCFSYNVSVQKMLERVKQLEEAKYYVDLFFSHGAQLHTVGMKTCLILEEEMGHWVLWHTVKLCKTAGCCQCTMFHCSGFLWVQISSLCSDIELN